MELRLTLPDWAGEYAREQVAARRYRSVDELVTELLDQSRALAANDRLAELIQEGMESGDGEEVTDEWWERIDEKVRMELQRRQSA